MRRFSVILRMISIVITRKLNGNGANVAKGRVLVIPDLHAPYQHPAAFDFLSDVAKRNRPETVVCIGDEIDAHSLSRYPKDPDGHSAGTELDKARAVLKTLFKLFPRVKCCRSNHTERPFRAAFAAGLPKGCLRPLGEILEAPKGWEWADSWDVNGVHYVHGEGFSGARAALTAAERFRVSTVIGHVHTYAGVQYSASPKDRIFGLNVGCLVDAKAFAFAYAKHSANKPTLGCGLVDGTVPVWIPLP